MLTRPQVGARQFTPWDNNFWLDVNYFRVARAAKECNLLFTAALYLEIWNDQEKLGVGPDSSSQTSQRTVASGGYLYYKFVIIFVILIFRKIIDNHRFDLF